MSGCSRYLLSLQAKCPDGGIGRRVGLKHQWTQVRAGSIPAPGTEYKRITGSSLVVRLFAWGESPAKGSSFR